MNESTKRTAVIIVAVLAVGTAAYLGYKTFAPTQLEPGVTHASPAKSMAQMEKEREARENAAAAGGGAAAEKGDAADASGVRPPGN